VTTLTTPDGQLYYEVRGSGPLLIITGAPMAARFFASLADALASDYTVVTHDPRGISASTLDDPAQELSPDLRADDLALLIEHLNFANADIFGSSGGGVTGLSLAARYPDRVRTLIAHEAPVLDLLPDAADHRLRTDAVVETFHREGLVEALRKFTGDPHMTDAGFSEQDLAASRRFFVHELIDTTRYTPDFDALKDARIVVGVGATSGADDPLVRAAEVLADRLATPVVEFPGDHGGFMMQPEEFASVVRSVL
jgi:pimeloyl-ACP methyl ester carboxylesterase